MQPRRPGAIGDDVRGLGDVDRALSDADRLRTLSDADRLRTIAPSWARVARLRTRRIL